MMDGVLRAHRRPHFQDAEKQRLRGTCPVQCMKATTVHGAIRPCKVLRGLDSTGSFATATWHAGRCPSWVHERPKGGFAPANKPESKARGRNLSPFAKAQPAAPAGIEATTIQQYRSLSVRLARKARLAPISR